MSKLVLCLLLLLSVCSIILMFLYNQFLNVFSLVSINSFTSSTLDFKLKFPDLVSFNFTAPSIEEVWNKVYEALPNLPTQYRDEKRFAINDCSFHPFIENLEFNNMFWQRYHTKEGTFYLYSAHLDIRKANNHGPAIRIIAALDHLDPTARTFCHIWTNGSKTPIITKAEGYTFLWRTEWTFRNKYLYQPYMITCILPEEIRSEIPLSVSLIEYKCDIPTNNLRVTLNLPEPGKNKTRFGVCVKALNFPMADLSMRIMEWLEILSVLGAEKVFLYSMGIHPNLQKVLDYYSKKGFVDLIPHFLPGFLPTQPALQYFYLKLNLGNQMLS